MAFIFLDPFNCYTSTGDVARRGYGNAPGAIEATAGRWGGPCCKFINGSKMSRAITTAAPVIMQFAIYVLPDGTQHQVEFLKLYNGSGAFPAFIMALTTANALRWVDRFNNTIWTGTGGEMSRGAWHTLAVQADIGNATGTLKIWLDVPNVGGSPTYTLTAQDLRGLDGGGGQHTGGCDFFDIYQGSAGGASDDELRMSDLLVYDTSGSAPWNAYLGDKRIYTLLPTSDDTANWTPSGGGNNFGNVDDAINAVDDGDSTYVSATSGAGADLYGFEDLPGGTSGVVGVVLETVFRKTDAGSPGTLKQRMKSGASTTDSAALTLSTSYQGFQHFSADVPGGSGWTESQVNALLAGQTV